MDGEGSFTYNRNGAQLAVIFALRLTAIDRPIVERVQDFFGVGKIYTAKARFPTANRGATKTSAYFRVLRHDELPRIVEHFDSYPLQSYKANSFKIWRGMVAIKREFRVRNREALEELALALSASQPRNQSWR
ncbi:MAG: hypothetical protein H0T42_00545 [Deltaproteobacteria bacterium]|nr:hypothetical protein [Deltaproteobacteria bacterium]